MNTVLKANMQQPGMELTELEMLKLVRFSCAKMLCKNLNTVVWVPYNKSVYDARKVWDQFRVASTVTRGHIYALRGLDRSRTNKLICDERCVKLMVQPMTLMPCTELCRFTYVIINCKILIRIKTNELNYEYSQSTMTHQLSTAQNNVSHCQS